MSVFYSSVPYFLGTIFAVLNI